MFALRLICIAVDMTNKSPQYQSYPISTNIYNIYNIHDVYNINDTMLSTISMMMSTSLHSYMTSWHYSRTAVDELHPAETVPVPVTKAVISGL